MYHYQGACFYIQDIFLNIQPKLFYWISLIFPEQAWQTPYYTIYILKDIYHADSSFFLFSK